MTKTPVILASFLFATAVPSLAFAQEGERPEPPFEIEDAVAGVSDRFSDVDANGDGYLTLEEMTEKGKGRRAKMAERMFDRQDENDDGFVSLEEMEAHARERLEKIDADGDGVITEEELDAARENMRGRRGGRRG